VFGQETPYRKRTPLFYIYDDGILENRIVIEKNFIILLSQFT